MANIDPFNLTIGTIGDWNRKRCSGHCYCTGACMREPLYYGGAMVQPPPERDPDLRKAALEALIAYECEDRAPLECNRLEKAMDALREALAK